jgi:hypothetical protein
MWTNRSEKGRNDFIDDESKKAQDFLQGVTELKKKTQTEQKPGSTLNPLKK